MTTTVPRAVHHRMTRVDIPTGIAFDAFRAAFEHAAPAFDTARVQRITDNGGTWDDVRDAVAANAPNELMVYAVIDSTQRLAVAGHRIKAVEYLLGNVVIAETMFRHDPKALLYAPLRVLVHSDPAGNAIFSMDRPSTAFASLGIPEITEVGKSLDLKVAALLRVIGVEPGDAFRG
jgi:uncharacterized protein (DUF302 family)